MDLVSPPVGYDSCHGVRATDNEPSDFKVSYSHIQVNLTISVWP